MNLYVWKDVLRDYKAGLAVVFAHDEDEAREIIKRDFPTYVAEQLPFSSCEVFKEPKGFYVYGGG